MLESLVYRHERLYEIAMRAVYGRHYASRERVIAERVPALAEVLDICCGPATLFRRHLRTKGVRYRGLDINPRFIERLRALGVAADVWDVSDSRALPRADIVVMEASLYHFLPDPRPVLDRMLAAARDFVIVSEPVRNLSASRFPPLAALGRRLTRVGEGSSTRFDEQRLDALMRLYLPAVRESFLIPGGREKVYLIDGQAGPEATRSAAEAQPGSQSSPFTACAFRRLKTGADPALHEPDGRARWRAQ